MGKPSIYMHNSTFEIKTMGHKFQKKILHKFLSFHWSVNLTVQWINPGYRRVRLFIRSSKILVSSPYTEGFVSYRHLFMLWWIKRQSFFSELAFLLGHRSIPQTKPISWWIHKSIANTMSQDSMPYAVVSVSNDGLCKCLYVDYFLNGFCTYRFICFPTVYSAEFPTLLYLWS